MKLICQFDFYYIIKINTYLNYNIGAYYIKEVIHYKSKRGKFRLYNYI